MCSVPRLFVEIEILAKSSKHLGIDLRGSGLSDPIKCDPELYDKLLPLYAKDEAGFEKLVQRNQALRQSCIDMTGTPLFDYMYVHNL